MEGKGSSDKVVGGRAGEGQAFQVQGPQAQGCCGQRGETVNIFRACKTSSEEEVKLKV